jgi:hypothetical protein
MKQCVKCKKIKLLKEFYKDSRTKDGLYCSCKKCTNKRSKKYRRNNLEKFREYQKKWRKNNPEKHKKWRKDNPEKQKEYRKKEYIKSFKMFSFRINGSISSSMRRSLKGGKSGRHWEDLVGYTLEDLMQHLEAQFEDWMTWDNHGKYEKGKKKWQIDHIKPKSLFNFETPEDPEFKECWALENLQPLEAMENIKKGNKFCEI